MNCMSSMVSQVIHMSSASPRGGGGPQANVGTLQMPSAIAPPTEALFFIKSPTLSPVPGALQLCKYSNIINECDLHFNEPSES